MKTLSSILAIMAMLAVATLNVHADQDTTTSQPEVEEKGTWAPMMRALEATDDSLPTSQPVADEGVLGSAPRSRRLAHFATLSQ